MSNAQISIQFFLQLACILVFCRIVGLIAKRLGQPQVVAEMIAGVLMGPSLFGLLLPEWQKLFFARPTMSVIYSFSQVGLVLYMFLVGVEFDVNLIRTRLRRATSVSLMGILMPFLLGILLTLVLLHQPGLFNPHVSPWQAMLFMSASISVTAFPMLARIIVERRLAGTPMGTLALAAGSIDDAAAWSILAILLAVFNGNSLIAFAAIGGGLVYAALVLLGLKPLLKPLARTIERNRGLSSTVLTIVLALVMFCGWITDSLGIYAIFGGFLLGTAMPRGLFSYHLRKTLEPVVTTFLLPLFFVYSGLNTHLDMVNTPLLWGITLLILLTSFCGKGVACWLGARLVRVPQREALAIATLMNARGLMELIMLNVALERGVITSTLFTMLVFMAVISTLIASPIFEFVYGRFRSAENTASSDDLKEAPEAVRAETTESAAR